MTTPTPPKRHYTRRTEKLWQSIIEEYNASTLTPKAFPMGKKNWLFSWTEIGAELIGIVQSLIVRCRMRSINPYDYFIDVLQRIDRHPASRTHELTPRLWKTLFVSNSLRSDLYPGDCNTF